MVAFAKSRGLPVTCEATPHHFALTDRKHAALRQQLQNEAAAALAHATWTAVIEGIVTGAIDAIATDHAPHPGSEKDAGVREVPVRHHRP